MHLAAPRDGKDGATPADSLRQRISDLVGDATLELSARDRQAAETCRAFIPPGRAIYINFAPGDSFAGSVEAARQLSRAGFRPVPHVAARYLTGKVQLEDFLARLHGEAGVDEALAIAGDRGTAAGPFHSSLELLESGAFEKQGFKRIGIAGYPEGHPKISTRALDNALRLKIARAHLAGLSPVIVTQFAFDARPILDWARRMRGNGVTAPLRVGLAGPASIGTLTKYALRCGVGNSIRALMGRQTSVTRLLTESGPEPVITGLIRADGEELNIAGLHVFNFGGVTRTGTWMRAISRGDFALAGEQTGFRVIAGPA
jgi:methylenetetrahydrofolate reductase (NADPH)